ncbi:hypothetical protein ACHAP8_004686 [Fusarium lateritium]
MPTEESKTNSGTAPAGPSGQSAPIVPPKPKRVDFTDDLSFNNAMAAYHLARAEHNLYMARYHEAKEERFRQQFQADEEMSAFWKEKASE